MQEEAQRIMDAQKKQRDAGYLAGEIERDPFDIHWLNKERAALIVEALLAFAQSATAYTHDQERAARRRPHRPASHQHRRAWRAGSL